MPSSTLHGSARTVGVRHAVRARSHHASAAIMLGLLLAGIGSASAQSATFITPSGTHFSTGQQNISVRLCPSATPEDVSIQVNSSVYTVSQSTTPGYSTAYTSLASVTAIYLKRGANAISFRSSNSAIGEYITATAT